MKWYFLACGAVIGALGLLVIGSVGPTCNVDDYPDLLVVQPGVANPANIAAADAALGDETRVIGVHLGDSARAYPLAAFEAAGHVPHRQLRAELSRHVVNDRLGNRFLAVTHCDRNGCTRVFTNFGRGKVVDVGVGGWQAGRMLLWIEGTRYEQESHQIPLEDYPFELTTWKEWRRKHPRTTVYIGPAASPPRQRLPPPSRQGHDSA